MVVVQVLNSYLQVGTPLTLLNGVVEQIDVRVERELVHRIYLTHVIQNEKQDRGSLRARSVTLATKQVRLASVENKQPNKRPNKEKLKPSPAQNKLS